MNRNKKVVGRMTVASALLVMTTITALGGSTEDSTKEVTGSVTLGKNGTAGIVAELQDLELVPLGNTEVAATEGVQNNTAAGGEEAQQVQEDAEESVSGVIGGVAELGELAAKEAARSTEEVLQEDPEAVKVALAETGTQAAEDEAGRAEAGQLEAAVDQEEAVQELVAAQEPETVQELAKAQEQTAGEQIAEEAVEAPADAEAPQEPDAAGDAAWSNMVMANVEEDMNIRMEPNAESELAGKFYRGDVAEVISVEGEWTKIVSGNAVGYVKNEYLVYGEEASQLANEVCSLYATVHTDGLRLRSEPNEEAGIVTTVSDGDRLKVNKEAEGTDGWVAVYTSDSTAYVSAEYVNVELNLGTALNSEEVVEKEARKAEEAREAEAASKKPAASANSDEVTLLGALIQCEAGGGSYDGMVAVGAVVMNRVRSGSYPGSISGVIYQGGQFTPAGNGGVARVMANGVNSSCLQAARDAINGTDNTNGALSFRSVSSGHAGRLIGANVFF